MRKLILLSIILLMAATSKLSAQGTVLFPSDPQKFLTMMTTFLQDEKELDNKTRKEVKDFMEEFTLLWPTEKFPDSYKKEIYFTCNLMVNKKMKPVPHFYSYMKSLKVFVNSDQPSSSFMAWQKGLKFVLGYNIGATNAFVNYINFTQHLFEDNSIYKSATTNWKANNKNYYFEFDSIPRLIVKSLNLTCYTKGDSANIYNTKGVYFPITGKWIGEGGLVDWRRAGFNETEVWATLKKYEIAMKYSKYLADSVTFHNTRYFRESMIGQLEDKVLANKRGENSSYPVFNSYNKRLQIPEIFKDIDYDGGFQMKGSRIIGTGSKEENAFLVFKRNGVPFIRAASLTFIIRKDRIAAASSAVTIFWEKDSIYHPSVRMKYLKSKNELSLIREQTGLGQSPYFDSFHKLDMFFEALYWKLDEPKIEMKMVRGMSGTSQAHFESANYYLENRFDEVQGMSEVNPLTIIKNCSRKYNNSRYLSLLDLAGFMKMSPTEVKGLLFDLTTRGFVIYNIEEETFWIKDKLFDYILARAGTKDYDMLEINSTTTDQTNATLSLLNFELQLEGVPYILLSDSQSVFVYPTDQQLVMKKNRDFLFSGRVHAGLFDFYGKNFYFDYERFKIDMPIVDSLSFKVRSFTANEEGEYPNVRVRTVLEDIKGDLLIDYVNNKSGLKPFDEYPIFNSFKKSMVYYDKKSIFPGVYKRDNFYFDVDPFTIDSLKTFKTDGLFFAGTMKTAGIFPDFEEKLRVQEDYSLGFKRSTSEGGVPSYGGKGTLNGTIKLSNQGLRADGTLTYLKSTSKSDDFIYFPDSLNAEVQDYEITATQGEVEYPPVKAVNVFEQWYPYKDLMVVSKMKTAINMYNGDAKLHGRIDVTPHGVKAHGTLEFKTAELFAENMDLKHHTVDSDSADFSLKAFNLSDIALKTKNYKSHIDFEKRIGNFKSNGGASIVEFPVNKYICYIDEFDWNMDNEEIAFGKKDDKSAELDKLSKADLADVQLSGSRFISIHPDQDSLEFYSPKAVFSTRKNIIDAEEVRIIKVADAAIYPSKGKVRILKEAKMETLENAEILANMATKYHNFYEATVNVLSRKRYKASAKYTYIDEASTSQQIYFDEIDVDTTLQTFAIGKISPTAKFTLSPQYDFTGKIKLLASMEFMTFDGATRIKHTCDSVKSWLRFVAEINPNDIYIPVTKDLRDLDSNRIAASVLLSDDSLRIYSKFLAPKYNPKHAELILAEGFLYFDKVSNEYRISNKEKLKLLSLPGNFISLGVNECVVFGEGKFTYGADLGQVKVVPYGNIKYDIVKDTAEISTVIAIDFHFVENGMKMISESFEKATDLRGVNLTSLTYTKALGEIVGVQTADKLISEINVYGAFKRFPDELRHTFFLNDVKQYWNPASNSFMSSGAALGVGNVLKTQINKFATGYFEIEKQKTGDILSLYLETSSNVWYFFTYKRGVMQAISSNTDFNTLIKDAKTKDRTLEVKKGETPYAFTLSTLRRKDDMVRKFTNKE